MSQLVPCPACGRHIRLPSSTCPFCDVAVNAGALEDRYASRRRGAPVGAKRAAVFALGAGLAAACGDDSDGGQGQPVYGAPVTTDETTTSPVEDAATTTDDTGPSPQPLYGAPVATTDDTTFVAIYGAPVSPEDAGTSDTLVSSDAAINDAAAPDAAVTDAGPTPIVVTDSGVQPVYGAPIFFDAALTDVLPGPDPTVAPAYGAPPQQN